MLENLDPLPSDSILGVTAAFRRDTSPDKVDLGVGVYRDVDGNTPVPAAVREAERAMLAEQITKTYVGPAGNLEFNERIVALALGPAAAGMRGRTATIQTVGGCGALRLGAELLRESNPGTVVHVSTPTWANHEPLLGSSGLTLQRYPYYDPVTRSVAEGPFLEAMSKLPPGSVVLLHGCCHNPTGVDLEPRHWSALAEIMASRGLLPFVDLAYQGFGDDIELDVAGLRLLVERVPEVLIAISCSKNFGLYRERTGALAVVGSSPTAAAAIATHQARIARRMYSMPPDHGAAVAARVLREPALRDGWQREVAVMVERMKSLRALLAGRLSALRPDLDFGWLRHQRGMFSLLGLDDAGVNALRAKHHVYMPQDGRINVAGISDGNVDYVARAVAGLIG